VRDRKTVGSVSGRFRITGGAARRRQPKLLLRLSGSLLFRFVAVQFAALLFQLPPRITRAEPHDRSPLFAITQPGEIAKPKRPWFG
jgi:hypothetical protein